MTTNNHLVRPFLKWAGGKRQLLPAIRRYVPIDINTYFEPFVGAGAVLFDTQPTRAIINDINAELVNCYKIVQTELNLLIADLSTHKNDKEYYYHMRDLDRSPAYHQLSDVKRASRIIFLNKTCYNGLFRVNSQGQFNVPFGSYKNPKILDEVTLGAIHNYLMAHPVEILNQDFEQAVRLATRGDFVYFDPPYDPVSHTASFTGYSLSGFNRTEQLRLKTVFDDLTERGCKVLLSNSATEFIRDLYQTYTISTIAANRAINSDALKRGKVEEVLVMNYVP